jgi:hypothetical protein
MWRGVLGFLVGCSYTPPVTPTDGAPVDGAVIDPDSEPEPVPQIVLTGLVQDLDADLGVSGTTNVTAWANQIAAGEDIVIAAATNDGPIVLVENAIGGHAALDFDNNARMEGNSTSAFAPLTTGVGLTWFAVVEPAATQDLSDRNQFFGTIRNGGNNAGFTAGVDRAAKPYAMFRPAAMEFTAQSPTPVTAWSVLAGRVSAGNTAQVAVYRNSSTPDAIVNATTANAQIGALIVGSERTGGTEFFDGRIARILIYARPLSDTELAETGRALGARYGIPTEF